MTDALARQMLASALLIDPDGVGPQTRAGITAEWDSMAHVRLVLELEARLGRTLAAEEILSLHGFTDVRALLSAPSDNS